VVVFIMHTDMLNPKIVHLNPVYCMLNQDHTYIELTLNRI